MATQLKDFQELFAKSQGELVEARADRETLIEQCLEADEYQGLIATHNSEIGPRFLFRSWNEALNSVVTRTPGL